jgi:hypothetical protein
MRCWNYVVGTTWFERRCWNYVVQIVEELRSKTLATIVALAKPSHSLPPLLTSIPLTQLPFPNFNNVIRRITVFNSSD